MVTPHDRWFLDRVATHILAWEATEDNEQGERFWFEGNFAAEENKIERLARGAARPHRVTHRRLTRTDLPSWFSTGGVTCLVILLFGRRIGAWISGPPPRRRRQFCCRR